MQINWVNLWTGGSAVILVGVDAAVLMEAAAWGLAGLTGVAPEIATVLYLLAAVAALLTTIAFARKAHSFEPFFERNGIAALAQSREAARHRRGE